MELPAPSGKDHHKRHKEEGQIENIYKSLRTTSTPGDWRNSPVRMTGMPSRKYHAGALLSSLPFEAVESNRSGLVAGYAFVQRPLGF